MLALVLMVLPMIVAPQQPGPGKAVGLRMRLSTPFDDARMKFDVRFYLVAILFIIFDLEVTFLFPWAIVLGDIGLVRLLVDDGLSRHSDRRLHL